MTESREWYPRQGSPLRGSCELGYDPTPHLPDLSPVELDRFWKSMKYGYPIPLCDVVISLDRRTYSYERTQDMKEYVTKESTRRAEGGKTPWLKFNVGQGLLLLALEIETGVKTGFKDSAAVLTVMDSQKKTYKLEWKDSTGKLRPVASGGFEILFDNGATAPFPLKMPFFLQRIEQMKYRLLLPDTKDEAVALWTGKINPMGTPNTPVVPTGEIDFAKL